MVVLNQVYRKNPNMVFRKVGDECLLVPIRRNSADLNSIYTLNGTASFVWDMIDGKSSLADIAARLVASYRVSKETAEEDLLSLAGFLEQEGGIEAA